MNLTDQLAAVPAEVAARAAFSVIDKLQDLPPQEQVTGAALLLMALCVRFNADPAQMLVAANRRLRDALAPDVNTRPGDYTRAVRAYINSELT